MARTASQTKTKTTEQQTPSRKPRSFLAPIIGILAVGALAALVVLDPEPPGVEYADLGNFHLAALDEPHAPYNSSPPSSGPHFGATAQWGVNEEILPAELFVHNLEDGGVILMHNCPDGCDDLADGLDTIVEETGRSSLSMPYDGNIRDPEGVSYRGAAVAWTRVFYFDELTPDVESEIDVFMSLYLGLDHHVGAGAVGGHAN